MSWKTGTTIYSSDSQSRVIFKNIHCRSNPRYNSSWSDVTFYWSNGKDMHPIPRLGASGHSKAFHLGFSWAHTATWGRWLCDTPGRITKLR